MKRLAIAALAAATFAAPLALPSDAAAHDRGRGHDRDRDWDRDRDRDHRGNRNRGNRGRDWDRDGRRGDRHDRWDRRRYNGYNYRGRWYYGPPPSAYRDHAHYGYRAWRRGDRLPRYYRDNYYVVREYNRYGLLRPPRGYHYVRDDRGDYLLVGIATGVILGVILGSH